MAVVNAKSHDPKESATLYRHDVQALSAELVAADRRIRQLAESVGLTCSPTDDVVGALYDATRRALGEPLSGINTDGIITISAYWHACVSDALDDAVSIRNHLMKVKCSGRHPHTPQKLLEAKQAIASAIVDSASMVSLIAKRRA